MNLDVLEFCAQPETPRRIPFSQGESPEDAVMRHDEGAWSRRCEVSLTSENI